MSDKPTSRLDTYIKIEQRFTWDVTLAAVYADDHAFAWLARMRLLADASHPTPAAIPRGVSKDALDAMVKAGLVALGPLDTFTIPGMAEARNQRAEDARKAGQARAEKAERQGGRFTSRPAPHQRTAGRNHQRPTSDPLAVSPALAPAPHQPTQTQTQNPDVELEKNVGSPVRVGQELIRSSRSSREVSLTEGSESVDRPEPAQPMDPEAALRQAYRDFPENAPKAWAEPQIETDDDQDYFDRVEAELA